jgi:hypothetical protein
VVEEPLQLPQGVLFRLYKGGGDSWWFINGTPLAIART